MDPGNSKGRHWTVGYRDWDGLEWQNYCMSLLRVRYSNHTLQEVPDRHRGDLGLEAFTQDGTAFQCYAAKEPLDTNLLYENQRDKLTEDLGKLKKNDRDLRSLLGSVVISRYVFMVHRHESRKLVAHAQSKAVEVREWGLPFIGSVFSITIETDEHYSSERDQIWAIPNQLIDMRPVDVKAQTEWGAQHAGLLDDARRKLSSIGLQGGALDLYLEKLLEQFLRGQNALDTLRSKYPDSWEMVVRAQSGMENTLTLEYPPGSTSAPGDVKTIVEDLAKEIRSSAPSVSEQIARALAWATVADWILRCPLDFEEPA